MVVGGSQQGTLDPGFVLLGTRQQGVPVILRELVLPGGFDLVSPSFTFIHHINQYLAVQLQQPSKHVDIQTIISYKQRWMVISNEMQDTCFILFVTRQLDIPASQS
ncbi:unnamed protein product [Schistosoma curassoni]|uniref:Uncharacterized protein n=1 Tax=Schistosoma curassoni TaxID=6186 RepID=A0A183KV70_9TREM|nr:unnamed protein product [Schistosoma curassoni]